MKWLVNGSTQREPFPCTHLPMPSTRLDRPHVLFLNSPVRPDRDRIQSASFDGARAQPNVPIAAVYTETKKYIFCKQKQLFPGAFSLFGFFTTPVGSSVVSPKI